MSEKILSVVKAIESVANVSFKPLDLFKIHNDPIVDIVKKYITPHFLLKVFTTTLILFIIYFVYRVSCSMVKKVSAKSLKPEHSITIQKVLKYLFYICSSMYILGLFGIKFSAILGAAGVAGVAIGFAAQTSISNIISGLFVMGEHTMCVGDLVTIDGITGVVDSTDLLSVKIHTTDNQLVRVPNSTMINTSLINTSFFPHRRMTLSIYVSYDTDMKFALDTLNKAPECCPTVLKDPAPSAWFNSFGENGIELVLAVWFNTADFLQTKNDAFIAIKRVFDEAKIEVPYNKLYAKVLTDGIDCSNFGGKISKPDGERV